MSGGRIIAYISAAILILLGILFVIATFSSTGQLGWLLVGLIMIGIGFGLIWFASRKPKQEPDVNVTYKVDLSGNVKMETIKCRSCGGVLAPDNIKMVAGAPVVTCPYCSTTYQLTEEPKW